MSNQWKAHKGGRRFYLENGRGCALASVEFVPATNRWAARALHPDNRSREVYLGQHASLALAQAAAQAGCGCPGHAANGSAAARPGRPAPPPRAAVHGPLARAGRPAAG